MSVLIAAIGSRRRGDPNQGAALTQELLQVIWPTIRPLDDRGTFALGFGTPSGARP